MARVIVEYAVQESERENHAAGDGRYIVWHNSTSHQLIWSLPDSQESCLAALQPGVRWTMDEDMIDGEDEVLLSDGKVLPVDEFERGDSSEGSSSTCYDANDAVIDSAGFEPCGTTQVIGLSSERINRVTLEDDDEEQTVLENPSSGAGQDESAWLAEVREAIERISDGSTGDAANVVSTLIKSERC